MSDAKLTSNELVAELLEVAKQVVRECESCYGKGERKHTFTGQMIACSKCADAKKAIARASSEQKSGKCADEASRDLRAPMPKGSLPNSLGNEHLYEPDQEWMNAPLGEHSAHEPEEVQCPGCMGPCGECDLTWRPIETAPHNDGHSIIAAIVHDDMPASVGEAHFVDGGRSGCWWWAGNDPGDHWGGPITPTHWMPMPSPPSSASTKEEGL